MYSERTLIIFILTGFTSIIPDFISFLNIVGAIGTSILGFILPPIYYLNYYGIKKLPLHIVIFNISLIGFGVGGGAYSVYSSIVKIINEVSNSS